ncbi:MAG: hypothetical protein QOG72_1675 [Sphingomonadales bacterium]|jgi:DNA-binding MarR family transcriptional regulator|nr:hypothetical protein [Sphingomonadales bacterium]
MAEPKREIGSMIEALGGEALRLAKGIVELGEAEALRRMSGRGTIELTARFVRGLVEARRLRTHYLGPILVPEPGWTLLLILYAARLDGLPALSPARLAAASDLPYGTVNGRLDALAAAALIDRRKDPERKRGLLVALTEETATRMHDYLMAAREL